MVDTPPHPALVNIVGPAAGILSSVPPPYQPVSVRHLDSQSSTEEPQDYLWLVNCESKKPEPNRSVCFSMPHHTLPSGDVVCFSRICQLLFVSAL